jgi:hypothetical protein
MVLIIQVVIGLKVVGGNDPPPPGCVIPEGSFDELILESNKRQPYYGFRCATSNTTVQVKKMKCMPYYCCKEPCNCGGPNVAADYMTCTDSTKPKPLSCYVQHIDIEGSLYGCCSGAEEDEFHACTKTVKCAVNNGGCDQLCAHNDTTGKDFCACYPGYQRQLTNSDGTILCKGESPSTTITPASVVSVQTAFPIPYIIAIIVGVGLLLLLLLLLLLILLCIRRRKKKAAEVPSLSSKPVVVFVTADALIAEKKVKDFGVKVEDDDDKVKVKGEKNGRVENDYSEDPVEGGGGRMEATSVYSNRIECEDGTYAEIPEKYEDLCESKYDEIPANIYEKSQS